MAETKVVGHERETVKGWKKTGKYYYRHGVTSNQYGDTLLQIGINKSPKLHESRYVVIVQRPGEKMSRVNLRLLDTYEEALAYAKDWMRKHPKG
jgi:hypothetical protein